MDDDPANRENEDVIAALYDIHGNLPALEAVLDDVRAAGAERIVVGGDVLPGPMAIEALDLLSALEIPTDFILGNGEVAALAERAGKESGVPAPYRAAVQWAGAQLAARHERSIGAWPGTLRLQVEGIGDVLFCHGTPRHENEIFSKMTPEERLVPIFEPTGAALVVCGHTHMQFDRTIGAVRVINAGSVGMPFGATGAYWLTLGPDVILRRTDYDLEAAATRIRRTAYPDAADFAANHVLSAPPEEAVLAAYAQAEVK